MSKMVFPKAGVIVKPNDEAFGDTVTGAISTGNKNITVMYPDNTTKDYPVDSISQATNTGRIDFSSNGTPYGIRELREDDGVWMSKYRTWLPTPALEQLIARKSRNSQMPDQDDINSDESLTAYASEDSPYVLALVYSNDSGDWTRVDGNWSLNAPDDTTFDGLLGLPIDPDKAPEYLDLYDKNYVSVADTNKFADTSQPDISDLPDESDDSSDDE